MSDSNIVPHPHVPPTGARIDPRPESGVYAIRSPALLDRPVRPAVNHKTEGFLHFLVNLGTHAASRVFERIHAKGDDMSEPILKIPVVCPYCASVSLAEMPIALIANGLLIGNAIRLHSRCHNRSWTATFAEREQLRRSLAALNTVEVA